MWEVAAFKYCEFQLNICIEDSLQIWTSTFNNSLTITALLCWEGCQSYGRTRQKDKIKLETEVQILLNYFILKLFS